MERDQHQEEVKRIEEAFIGNEFERAQAKTRKYRWVLNNDFAGDDKENSSDDENQAQIETAETDTNKLKGTFWTHF